MNVQCQECRKVYDLPITVEQVTRWRHGGGLIQRVFPDLTDDQRELLISQTCGACFDAMFAEAQ